MIIVSQDKDLILNFKNIDAIGIGNPLENDDGLFKILASTTSDNEYTLGKYKTEERAKEILQEIINLYKKTDCVIGIGDSLKQVVNLPKIFEMPER